MSQIENRYVRPWRKPGMRSVKSQRRRQKPRSWNHGFPILKLPPHNVRQGPIWWECHPQRRGFIWRNIWRGLEFRQHRWLCGIFWIQQIGLWRGHDCLWWGHRGKVRKLWGSGRERDSLARTKMTWVKVGLMRPKQGLREAAVKNSIFY